MSDQREYPPGPERPAGRPTAAVPAGRPAPRPVPPAPPAAAHWPTPTRPPGPRPQPAGGVPAAHPRRRGAAAGRRRPTRSRPPHHPPVPPPAPSARSRARRAAATRPRPARRPAAVGTAHGGGPRPPSDDDGGRRRPRRLLWTLVALLGLGLLAPVVAFVVGWVIFTCPSADQTRRSRRWPRSRTPTAPSWPPSGRTNVNRIDRHRSTRCPPHVRQAVLAAEDRSFYSNPGFDLDRHRAGRVEPGHRRRRRRLDDHPAVREGHHRPGRRARCGASTRRSSSRSRSPRSRRRTRSSRTTSTRSTSAAAPTASRPPARPTSARTSRQLTVVRGRDARRA